MGVGAYGTVRVTRLVRETVERYTPERVSAEAADTLRRLADDVRAALAEGRVAMRAREAELRESLGSPR